MSVELTIERLGTDGAGLAHHQGRIIAVPLALPGERVRVELPIGKAPARLVERLSDSPARATPPCRHFGTCGGCALQHLDDAAYAEFKSRLIGDALARAGIADVPIEPVRVSPPASRRRATIELRRLASGAIAGFHEPASRRIVDLAECPILVPALTRLLPALRRLVGVILRPGAAASAVLDATDTGIDLGLVLSVEPDLAMLETLAAFAEAEDLARLWWRPESGGALPIAERRKPTVSFGSVPVALPPGAFRQATADGEASLVETVRAAIGEAGPLADLFAGIGTFALPLAAGREVRAVEADATALGALAAAARRSLLVGVTTERRDLEERPLSAAELGRFAAIVLDPPRAGARAQVAEIAGSRVPVVAYVSCNPSTFARDAAILVAGGYRIERIVPVDQFLWSPHLELVAVLRKVF